MNPPSLTIGIEEEYQFIHPETRELESYVTEILEEDHVRLGEVKPEYHQSMVEIGTGVCRTAAEARAELLRLRGTVRDLASRKGLLFAAAGTHPFSSWLDQDVTPLARYTGVKQDLREVADRLLIFGMHVHIGIEDREFLIDAMNVARYFIPHLLCLTTSSPFWMGRKTGLKSYRTVVFKHFPRTGIPRPMRSWAEYEELLDVLVRTRCIEDGSKIYWDVRPHHAYPTLEFRAFDACPRVDEAICAAAILQAIVAKLWKLRTENMTFRVYDSELIEENKWRAVRYGLDGKLLDLGREEEVPARELVRELLEWFIDDVVDDLGCREEVEYAERILEEGTSADRQLALHRESGDLRDVVDGLVEETSEGLAEAAGDGRSSARASR